MEQVRAKSSTYLYRLEGLRFKIGLFWKILVLENKCNVLVLVLSMLAIGDPACVMDELETDIPAPPPSVRVERG